MTQINLTLDNELLKDIFVHSDGEAMKTLLEEVFNAILSAEAEEQIGAKPYERTDERKTYRNGTRTRLMKTRVGTLELHIPKLRNGHFSTKLFQRYQRNEKAFVLALMESVINGVSTRNVTKITETLCGTSFSHQTISNLCKELDGPINKFRNRPLTAKYPFLWADAMYTRTHTEDRGVINVGLFIVLGVREDGVREVLSFSVSERESELTWSEVFSDLKVRGLDGVQLITSDAHGGIQKAIKTHFPGVAWQRCQTHFSKNILDGCPKKLQPELKEALKDMYNAPNLEECKNRRDAILEKHQDLAPRAMRVLDEGWNDIVSIYAFAPELRKKLRTSNPVERVNQEVRRRERVIRIFPNQASILRLLGALLIEMHEKWASRKYMNMDILKEWETEKSSSPMGEELISRAIA